MHVRCGQRPQQHLQLWHVAAAAGRHNAPLCRGQQPGMAGLVSGKRPCLPAKALRRHPPTPPAACAGAACRWISAHMDSTASASKWLTETRR